MPSPQVNTTRWRKSSYSNSDGGNCVEVSEPRPGAVLVRDSKNPAGPVLVVGSAAWQGFLRGAV